MSAVGQRIRARRNALGLSQERCALEAGLAAKSIGAIERGENTPRMATLEAIAKALGVTVEDLCAEEGDVPRGRA